MTARDEIEGVGGTDLLCEICTEERGIDLQTLEQTIRLAVEIAREGREGRKIGTMFVVSESPVVRVFDDGEIVSEIIPELWLFRRHGLDLEGPYATRTSEQMMIASKKGTTQNSP
jgi:hypothetical protein